MTMEDIKLCPFCESPMMVVEDEKNGGEPYYECSNCGLRFKTEGFNEKPVEVRE